MSTSLILFYLNVCCLWFELSYGSQFLWSYCNSQNVEVNLLNFTAVSLSSSFSISVIMNYVVIVVAFFAFVISVLMNSIVIVVAFLALIFQYC